MSTDETFDVGRDRRLLEQAREAEERWRSLIENPFDFVCIVDRKGVYQYVNHTLPGVSMEDLIGKRALYDHIASDHHEEAERALDKVFSLATSAHFEAHSPPPVDTWFSIVVGPVRHDGDVVFASLLAQDITPRKVAEAARRESERRFQQLAESIGDIFYLLEPKRRRLLYLSPAYEKIWGRSPGILDRHPRAWQEGIHPEDRAWVLAHLRKALRQDDPSLEPIEYRVMHPDGSLRWVRHRAFAAAVGAPESRRIAGVVTDITEQKLSLAETHQARAFSLQVLEAQEEERSSLASELHDEFGQSLTVLSLLLAAAGRGKGERRDAELQEATSIVGDLLAKVRDRSLDLRPAMLDDFGLLPALLNLFRTFTRRTGIEVQFDHHALGIRFTPTLETTAYRVVQEALTNVARHAKVNEVKVGVSFDEPTLNIRIEDGGGGFDLEAARSHVGGIAGLRERVRLQDGELEVESVVGGGSRLSASLPGKPGCVTALGGAS